MEDTKSPAICAATVVGLTKEDFGSGIVFAAAAGREEWRRWRSRDAAGESEIGEAD